MGAHLRPKPPGRQPSSPALSEPLAPALESLYTLISWPISLHTKRMTRVLPEALSLRATP